MNDKTSFLVVGGDSLVGGGLMNALSHRGHRAYASTRRKETLNEHRVFLDFESDEPYLASDDVGYAYVVAAATNYDRCEKDPLAHKINVELIPRLVQSLLKRGIFVTFISTNSVFGGELQWPHEEDKHDPRIAYAIQKDEAEKAIQKVASEMSTENRLNVVRLTKILDPNTPPVPAWIESWQRGEVVQPFADLIFAPMSVQFVGESLATIGKKRVSGNLHLSGADNVSYVDFALALTNKMGIDKSLIDPTTATAKGIHIAYKPSYSGLGMQRTTELTGVKPQTLNDVVNDLLEQD